jgi:D-tyrosyl-tRNA(Tyr) deacylase
MRVVIQRVSQAQVSVDNKVIGKIGMGLMILLGIENADTQEDIDWLVHKIKNLRIFNDDNGIMNKSLLDVQGEVLIVSQFTLHAKTKKGHRPSYIHAAKPDIAIPLYEAFINTFRQQIDNKVASGQFGAMMDVSLTNHGPVTILIDTKRKE